MGAGPTRPVYHDGLGRVGIPAEMIVSPLPRTDSRCQRVCYWPVRPDSKFAALQRSLREEVQARNWAFWEVETDSVLRACRTDEGRCCLVVEAGSWEDACGRLRWLRQRAILCPVIVLLEAGEALSWAATERFGTTVVVWSSQEGRTVMELVDSVLSPTAPLWRWQEEYEELSRKWQRLTQREKESVELLVSGLSNKQIAYRLGITVRAVELRRSRVMRKWQIESITELCRLVFRMRWLEEVFGIAGSASDVPCP
ncbi:MAG: hypothetical protein KatS3mg110_4551 [Pirellulaceae bacterium]|nr:MAG: hypothetical protein KatS3mg110_4551 [Pirellulaceae bacterium]